MMNLVQVPAIHHTSSHPNHPAPAHKAGGEIPLKNFTLNPGCPAFSQSSNADLSASVNTSTGCAPEITFLRLNRKNGTPLTPREEASFSS